MTIRTRLTLWFTSILFLSLLAMGGLTYYEFVAEPRSKVERAEANEETQENGAEDLLAILAWCGLPALAISLGGGWWMMRKSLAPVARLTSAAERLNEHTLGQRLPCTGNGDEFDRLTEVFNAMTGRLEQSFQRISDFTLHASHELKTPLTVLRAEAETALQHESLKPTERQRLESQMDELQRLTTIVDALSLLTKADAGQVALKFQPVALHEIVRENFADTQLLARACGLTVELAVCEPVTVRADPHRLRQLLLNLADNAVKHNHHGGSITMALRRADSAAQFTISNTGAGISPEALPRVFDRFFRGDPAHNRAVEGCGLGLSIAQWIVQAHHGTITVESAPTNSTTVTVHLPLDNPITQS
jgi:heavy metal sensor kinase